MRLRKKCFLLLLVFISMIIFYVLLKLSYENVFNNLSKIQLSTSDTDLEHKSVPAHGNNINIAVVACGQRLSETLVMLKSAILFNGGGPFLKLYVIAEESLKQGFQEKLTDWKSIRGYEFDFEILSLNFPTKNTKEWKSLFKPCAAQRLFLPALLKDLDSVLYMDTDTVFLSPISDIWIHFEKFNATQFAGLSPEHEDKNVGWYNRFARHPFYGPMGVNSGVMLMNLTRMRNFNWEDHILPIHEEYKLKITWGDQDLINILFYFHPENLYIFPCAFNYRPDHCMYMSVCNATNGIQIMHGNRGYFHSDKQPLFKAVYDTLESYQIGTDPYINFLEPLSSAMEEHSVVNSNCGKVRDHVIDKSKKTFLEKNYYYNRR